MHASYKVEREPLHDEKHGNLGGYMLIFTFDNNGLSSRGSKRNDIFVEALEAESICFIHLPRDGSEGRAPQVYKRDTFLTLNPCSSSVPKNLQEPITADKRKLLDSILLLSSFPSVCIFLSAFFLATPISFSKFTIDKTINTHLKHQRKEKNLSVQKKI